VILSNQNRNATKSFGRDCCGDLDHPEFEVNAGLPMKGHPALLLSGEKTGKFNRFESWILTFDE